MYAVIDDTLGDGLERGFSIFRDGDGYRRTEVVTGGPTSVDIPVEGEIVATFHTHPQAEFDELMSIVDTQGLINLNLEFAAIGMKEGESKVIKVYTGGNYETFPQLQKVVQEDSTINDRLDAIKLINDELFECQVIL